MPERRAGGQRHAHRIVAGQRLRQQLPHWLARALAIVGAGGKGGRAFPVLLRVGIEIARLPVQLGAGQPLSSSAAAMALLPAWRIISCLRVCRPRRRLARALSFA
jgi:hypothetical protein